MSQLLNQHKKRLVGLLDRAFIYVGNNSEVKVGRPTIHVGKLSWINIEQTVERFDHFFLYKFSHFNWS